jgi:putative peptide zinc metalloprotease protein
MVRSLTDQVVGTGDAFAGGQIAAALMGVIGCFMLLCPMAGVVYLSLKMGGRVFRAAKRSTADKPGLRVALCALALLGLGSLSYAWVSGVTPEPLPKRPPIAPILQPGVSTAEPPARPATAPRPHTSPSDTSAALPSGAASSGSTAATAPSASASPSADASASTSPGASPSNKPTTPAGGPGTTGSVSAGPPAGPSEPPGPSPSVSSSAPAPSTDPPTPTESVSATGAPSPATP